jgi:fructose-specific phosphotransferase system component IIB
MAAMTNLLVKDDANPLVEQTLVPITDNPLPFWRGSASGVPLEGQIRAYMSSEQVKSGAYKLTMKVEVPVMETLGASGTASGYVAPPKVAYVNTTIITMFADQRSTNADRYNAFKLAIGLAQGASSTTATGVLNQASAADAWKNSTLPGPLFFGQLVVPN